MRDGCLSGKPGTSRFWGRPGRTQGKRSSKRARARFMNRGWKNWFGKTSQPGDCPFPLRGCNRRRGRGAGLRRHAIGKEWQLGPAPIAPGGGGDRRRTSEQRSKPLIVAIRSTVFPGTCEEVVLPAFADQRAVSVVSHPEFLREGSAVRDFFEPSLVVVGGNDRGGDESGGGFVSAARR